MKCALPDSALNQHIAILGKTGAGKTWAAKTIVEYLLSNHRQVCVVDPTGAWWGMRLGADGKSRGYDLVLLGGNRADIPVAERSGAAVARLVTEQRASVIIDTSGFTVGEYTRWFIDFAGTLYTTIGFPLHLVIDEAHYFMPQGKSPDEDAGRMLHAGNRLMSGGRSKGIRGMLITQRPAKLHKDSLTCADSLISMRVIAPQDRSAIKEWIDGAGDPVQGKAVLDSLAQLKRGEGWVWYPEGGYLQRVTFPKIETYDSSATPTHGAKAGPKVTEIKLEEVKAALAEAVKEAEANDPKLLRAEIARLKAAKPTAVVDEQAVAHAVASATRELKAAIGERDSIIDSLKSKMGRVVSGLESKLVGEVKSYALMLSMNGEATPKVVSNRPLPSVGPARRPVQSRHPSGGSDAQLGKCERAVLTALYWLRDEQAVQAKVAFYAGYSVTSSGFGNALSALRTAGLIERLSITPAGIATVESWEAPDRPAGSQLREWLRGKLGRCENAVLDALCKSHPNVIPFDKLAENSGYSSTSSGFKNALSGLRTIEALEGYARDGGAKAADVFFE